jgi:aminopeptidase N
MLAIGKITEKTKCGTELELYLEHKDAARFEPAYRYSVRMFDWKGNRWSTLESVQANSRSWLCMPEWKILRQLFSSRYVVDSTGFEDRNYTNVNAHELAHQWFGI